MKKFKYKLSDKKNFNSLLQRYRFFFIFIIIGLISLIVEFFVYNFLNSFNFDKNASSFLGLIAGVLFAFYFNFFFNFEIHKSKITRVFSIFIIICFFSWSFQKFISIYFVIDNISYELKRLATSGIFFIIGYYLHRKFSFNEFKKVGVAFYLTRTLNLNKIFKIIGNNSNFMHIDIVDKSFSKSKVINEIPALKKVIKIWPKHEIHAHIMSKYPTKWVKKIIDYSDVIFVHWESHENLNKIRKEIVSKNKKFGVAITLKTNPKKIIPILKKSSALLILAVDDPGFSGQRFNFKTFDYIEFFNKLKFRDKFRMCIDGGVNKNIVKILNVDDVVSNSSILGSDDPVNEIINLQSAQHS